MKIYIKLKMFLFENNKNCVFENFSFANLYTSSNYDYKYLININNGNENKD